MARDRTPSDDPAAWMRDEYKTLRELSTLLRQHLASVPEADLSNWLAGLRVAFDRLEAHLQQIIEGQEEGGYLAQVLEARPSLSREVERLKSEHGELLKMAAGVRNDLAQINPENRLLAADVSARIQRFMAIVDQHKRRENMITMLVFNEDLGAGD